MKSGPVLVLVAILVGGVLWQWVRSSKVEVAVKQTGLDGMDVDTWSFVLQKHATRALHWRPFPFYEYWFRCIMDHRDNSMDFKCHFQKSWHDHNLLILLDKFLKSRIRPRSLSSPGWVDWVWWISQAFQKELTFIIFNCCCRWK